VNKSTCGFRLQPEGSASIELPPEGGSHATQVSQQVLHQFQSGERCGIGQRQCIVARMPDEITRRTFIGTAAVIVLAPVVDGVPEQAAAASRRTLHAATDRIIPAQGKMPAASAVGAVEYLEALSARDQDVQQRLAKALAALGPAFGESSENEQIGALEKLEKADPPSFAALRDVVYEAYYTNPKVWALIGYPFRTGNKRTAPLEDFDTKLLGRVRQLPRLYRETD
jgi:Gluconate 2-dehydrogenase subunit 3